MHPRVLRGAGCSVPQPAGRIFYSSTRIGKARLPNCLAYKRTPFTVMYGRNTNRFPKGTGGYTLHLHGSDLMIFASGISLC
jgi:hypothetical protein